MNGASGPNWDAALDLLKQSATWVAGSGLFAWIGTKAWLRWKRGDEAVVAIQHDVAEAQRQLVNVSDDQSRRTFEMMLAIIRRQDEECERRLSAMERAGEERMKLGEERQRKLDNAVQRIGVLEALLRDHGVPLPP